CHRLSLFGGYFLELGQQRGAIGEHQQGGFMVFPHHQVDFDITQAGALLDHVGALVDRHAAFDGSSAVLSIPPLALASAVFEIFVEVFIVWVGCVFGGPYPLVEGLMGNPIDPFYLPAATDELRGEFLFGQPPASLGFQVRSEPAMFGFSLWRRSVICWAIFGQYLLPIGFSLVTLRFSLRLIVDR